MTSNINESYTSLKSTFKGYNSMEDDTGLSTFV